MGETRKYVGVKPPLSPRCHMSKEEERDADVILTTMWLGLMDLHEGFSDFIELEE